MFMASLAITDIEANWPDRLATIHSETTDTATINIVAKFAM
jgi:hypothetical protein